VTATIGYVLGYSEGRSDAERSRDNQDLVNRVFDGRRPVTIDQSQLDELIARAEKFRSDSNLNFKQANLFEREAHQWKADSERHETRANALQAQIASLHAQLAERSAALAKEQLAHLTTNEQKRGLNLFRLIATWLIDAHTLPVAVTGRLSPKCATWPNLSPMRSSLARLSTAIATSRRKRPGFRPC
jgi:hypothetical protein